MGLLKRIFRQTSYKLLAKLGAQRESQEVAYNTYTSIPAPTSQVLYANPKQLNSKRARRHRKKSRAHGTDASEALLITVKNSLPPLQFHHVHGQNAQLSNNSFVARRTRSFCQALVFSNRVILPNERVYIKVLEIAKGWSGTIRFGFTAVDPATLRYHMPEHACPDMTNQGHTWARALADEVVRRNSVIHFSYDSKGYIHYGINNQDCGIFFANVNTSQNLWFIVDVYGLTAAVELIDPRIHNASSEPDFTRLDRELRSGAALPQSPPDTALKAPAPLPATPARSNLAATYGNFNNHMTPPSAKSKSRHSAQSSAGRASRRALSNRDNNNKSIHNSPKSGNNNNGPPQTRDCPICFERPINCVLYQCGHMCTCYECGVKQWRTQSRTCPICRTIIKDVIKTYMS